MCNTKIVIDPTRATTSLQNISFYKLHQPKAQHWQTRRVCIEENVTVLVSWY